MWGPLEVGQEKLRKCWNTGQLKYIVCKRLDLWENLELLYKSQVSIFYSG